MAHLSFLALHDELRREAETAGELLARRQVTNNGRFQQLAIHLGSGGELPEHGNPGDAQLHVLSGTVRFIESDGYRTHALSAGDLFEVPNALHRVEADTESLLLLTFALRA